MTYSVDQLFTEETTDAVFEKFLVSLELLGLRPRLWKEGGALRTILKIVASVYAGFTSIIVSIAKMGFLPESSGGWLTLLAYAVYGVERIPSTFATGELRLTNSGGGIYSVPIGSLRVSNIVTGKTFENVEIVNLNPGDSLLFDFRATEIGSASNSPIGSITKLETILPGVAVNNESAVVGSDEESDVALRQRCLDKLGTISGLGPRGAYAYATKSAKRPDGTYVDVNRLRISPSSSTGIVSIVVASASGIPIPSDLPYIVENIEALARPDTVTVTVASATSVTMTKSYTVWAKRTEGLDVAGLETIVQNALLILGSTYPIGGIAKPPAVQGYLFYDNVVGTIKASNVNIFDVDGDGLDFAINPGEIVEIDATLDIRFVDVPS